MNGIVPALLPVMLLIALGFLLRRSGLVAEAAWAGLEKVAYYVFFPALLIYNLGGQSLQGVPWLPMLFVILATC
ncbi:MAG: AEC family transporter, partial [Pseudomonadota bacterium]